MQILESILTAASLCADCFAVALCSSLTLKKIDFKQATTIAISFAIIQTGLLLAGWAFGSLLAGLVHKISHIIGFLLLLYVGGSMVIEGAKGKCDGHNLNGAKNIILGGIATSIDAVAVGVAQSMETDGGGSIWTLAAAVFAITMISVVAGIFGGKKIGQVCGNVAEVVGGLVLVGIGVSFLF